MVASALCSRHWEVLALLVAHGGVIGQDDLSGISPVVLLRCVREESCLELVLRARVDVNGRDRLGATPLLWAVARGPPGAVRTLLSHGQT